MSTKKWGWLLLLVVLAGCGHQGALYLPSDSSAKTSQEAQNNVVDSSQASETNKVSGDKD